MATGINNLSMYQASEETPIQIHVEIDNMMYLLNQPVIIEQSHHCPSNMRAINYTEQKDVPSKRFRYTYTSYQLDELEKEFKINMYLDGERRKALAQRLQVSERKIKVWFQNRRMKNKKLFQIKDTTLQDTHAITERVNDSTGNKRLYRTAFLEDLNESLSKIQFVQTFNQEKRFKPDWDNLLEFIKEDIQNSSNSVLNSVHYKTTKDERAIFKTNGPSNGHHLFIVLFILLIYLYTQVF